MATKKQVIDLHLKHPDWNSEQIADRLGCMSSYVRATFYRNGLTLPKRLMGDSLARLGYAARQAGLTVADIERIRKGKRAAA